MAWQELPSTSKRLAHTLFCNVLPHACRDRPDDPRGWADTAEIRYTWTSGCQLLVMYLRIIIRNHLKGYLCNAHCIKQFLKGCLRCYSLAFRLKFSAGFLISFESCFVPGVPPRSALTIPATSCTRAVPLLDASMRPCMRRFWPCACRVAQPRSAPRFGCCKPRAWLETILDRLRSVTREEWLVFLDAAYRKMGF